MDTLSNVSFRVDASLKKQAEELFDQLGMSMTTAFNIFLRQSVREGSIPFDITTKTKPNAETVAVLLEAKQLMNDKTSKAYSLEDAIKELKA